MNKEYIIRMAREAGMVRVTSPSGIELGQWWGVELVDIEHFAALVAAAEREACAKVCDEEAERKEQEGTWLWEARRCAAAIRSRSEIDSIVQNERSARGNT